MKKIIFVIFVIFVLMNLGQGCKPEHDLIIDIDFSAAFVIDDRDDKRIIYYECTSTINDKLVFVVPYKTKRMVGHIANLGNVCYATSVPTVIDNELVQNTFKMTFDKEFIYNGNIIPTSTNIFELEFISKEIDMYENYKVLCAKNKSLVLDFSDIFFKNSVFDTTKEYIVTFSCETSDDIVFEKTITIKFENL